MFSMSGAERIDVRGLCVRRDLGDMGLFWGYINVTVSYTMSRIDRIDCPATSTAPIIPSTAAGPWSRSKERASPITPHPPASPSIPSPARHPHPRSRNNMVVQCGVFFYWIVQIPNTLSSIASTLTSTLTKLHPVCFRIRNFLFP